MLSATAGWPVGAGGAAAGLATPEALYAELQHNFPVLLLLMFMVAGIYFMKDLLLLLFSRLLLGVRSKTLLSLLFCLLAALLSAFLDALTVTAVVISVAVAFFAVSPGRFGAARQRGLRSRHRPPGPRAAPGPSRGIPRLPPQPAHARGGRHRAGRRLHPGGRAAEPADRPRGRLAFRRVLPPGRAGIHAGTGGRPADLRAAGEEPPLRLWRPVAGGGAPGARRVRRQRKPQTRSAAEGRAAGAGPGGAWY